MCTITYTLDLRCLAKASLDYLTKDVKKLLERTSLFQLCTLKLNYSRHLMLW